MKPIITITSSPHWVADNITSSLDALLPIGHSGFTLVRDYDMYDACEMLISKLHQALESAGYGTQEASHKHASSQQWDEADFTWKAGPFASYAEVDASTELEILDILEAVVEEVANEFAG